MAREQHPDEGAAFSNAGFSAAVEAEFHHEKSAPSRAVSAPRGPRAIRFHFAAFAICLTAAIVFTLPTSLSPRSALLGDSGDNFQHAWFLWYFARAVTHFHNPFYTNLIYYPSRVNLSWSTLDPLAGLLALPLSLTLGPVAAYNLSIVLQLTLSAFFARLLCLRICGDETAALIGGMCFGFSPFLLAHALGHLSLVTAFPIPLFLLALDNLLSARAPNWKEGVWVGVALFLTALSHYNYTVICLMLLAAVVILRLAMEGVELAARTWKSFCWAGGSFLVLFSPILAMLLGRSADRPSPRPLDHIVQYSADVFGFLIPSWNHVLLGHFAKGLNANLFVAGFEGTVYASPVILFFAALGFWKRREINGSWGMQAAIIAGLFYLLSLGPALRFFGKQTAIPGPAALLYHFPTVRFLSAPARFQAITALCLAILCSIGLAALLKNVDDRWRSRKHWLRLAIPAVATALLLLDLLTIPFPASSIADPAWLSDSGGAPERCELPAALQKGTIVTFPLTHWPYSMKSTWMQVSDQGRYALVDGYLSYTPDRVWRDYYNNPILRSLLLLQGEFPGTIDTAADRLAAPAALRELNASAAVVFDSPWHDAAVKYLQTILQRSGQSAGSCTVFAIGQRGGVSRN
jgi:hypothetical protein